MLKLATPVQYEYLLDTLNILRPLNLLGECKMDIAYPVLNMNPVGKTEPAMGKLARCDEQGALLTNERFGYENYEMIEKSFYFTSWPRHITFAQTVYKVLAHTIHVVGEQDLSWRDPTLMIEILVIPRYEDIVIPFVGETMQFYGCWSGTDIQVVNFYGFY